MSIEGNFIKKKATEDRERYTYYIDRNHNLDSSLVQLVTKMLPVCEFHDELTIFIQNYSSFEYGLIYQALCNSLKVIKREFVTAVNVLDLEFQKNNLNLSRL